MLRAKFQVLAVKDIYSGTARYSQTVKLIPVYSPDRTTENYQFWQATPAGELTMHINNPEAFDKFREGQQYYLDFTPAEVPVSSA